MSIPMAPSSEIFINDILKKSLIFRKKNLLKKGGKYGCRKRTGKDKDGVVFPIAPVKKKEFEVLTIAAAAAAGFMALGWSFFLT